MATTQRPKHPAHRISSGNNILTRMLQMEKQSRHQRASSISPISDPSPKAECINGSASYSPRPPNLPSSAPHSPLRPFHFERAQTSPVLNSTVQATEEPQPAVKAMALRVSTDIDSEVKPAEICLSPSWSDHGEKARKKEKRKAERDQKEREKRLRQDEERQKAMDLKAGKRLSKKQPPAAMETQKMPTSLRRNSWKSFMSVQSSSGENSRRSSRDEDRLSSISFGSTKSKRSQSTPATSTESSLDAVGTAEPWKPIVSPSAPKLPSFRFSSSRKVFSDQAKPASTGKEDASEQDLVAFTYRLETHGVMNEPMKIGAKSPTDTPLAEMPSTPTTPSFIGVEPPFKSVPYESMSKDNPQPVPVGKNGKPNGQWADGHDRSRSGQAAPRLPQNSNLSSPHVDAQSPIKPAHDGSSYVHKQRMYQQQQSIAGFEDQQAIIDATEAAARLAAEKAQGPKPSSDPAKPAHSLKTAPTHGKDTSVSSVYVKQRDRSSTPPSPRLESAPAKEQSAHPTSLSQVTKPLPETPAEKHQAALQNAEKTMTLGNDQAPVNQKTDKILGFRRRTKPSPALISIPYNAENQVLAVQSAPPENTPNEEPGAKRSRIERLFREPKPAFANKERRASSSSSKDQVKAISPDIKPAQSHSRTRTASSTAVNDNVAASTLKSKTEAPLAQADNQVKDAPLSKNEPRDKKKSPNPAKQSPQKPHSRKSSTVAALDPKSKPNSKPTPPQEDVKTERPTPPEEDKTKAGKKQAHEVVVESETGEGLIRKTSIKRPRSNPQIQKPAAATDPQVIDFLPPLKHQPLVKRERHSPTRVTASDYSPVSISQFQEPIAPLGYESPNPPDLKLIPRSPFRPPSAFPIPTTSANRFNRSATEVSKVSSFGKGPPLSSGVEGKPLAKLFVICCKCKFWHDLPSKLYEAMALPLELHKADKGKVSGARLETAVKCPWCEHGMTTGCCQGWTTVVYLHERHH